MIKEEKIEFTAKWCKYSKYKIEKKDDKFYIVADNAVVNFRDIYLTYIPLSNKAYESEEDIIHNKKVVKKTELNFLARFGKRIAYHNNIGPYQSM